MISLIVDNRRMRKQIKQYEQQGSGSENANKHDQAKNQGC